MLKQFQLQRFSVKFLYASFVLFKTCNVCMDYSNSMQACVKTKMLRSLNRTVRLTLELEWLQIKTVGFLRLKIKNIFTLTLFKHA